MRYNTLVILLFIFGTFSLNAQEYDLVFDEDVDYDTNNNDTDKPARLKKEQINETFEFYFNENLSKYKRKYGLLKNGKMLLPQIFTRLQYIDTVENTELILSVGSNTGLFSLKNENWGIPLRYKSLYRINNGYYIAKRKDGKTGIIDANENTIVNFDWLSVKKANEKGNYFIVSKKNTSEKKYGILDLREKKLIVPCEYSSIYKNGPNLEFKVKNADKKYNIIDLSNRKKYKIWYEEINFVKKENLYIVKNNNAYGVIDSIENIIVPLIYNKIYSYSKFDNDLHMVQNKEGKFGYIKLTGEIIIPLLYDKINTFDNNFLVKKDNKYGIINKHGKFLTEISYNNIIPMYLTYSENEKYYLAQKNLKSFIINEKGKIVDDKYVSVKVFDNYKKFYFKIENKNRKKGLINKNRKIIIPAEFDDILTKQNNFVVVKNNKKEGIYHILKKKLILPVEYDKVILNSKGFYAIKDNKFYKIRIENKVSLIKM